MRETFRGEKPKMIVVRKGHRITDAEDLLRVPISDSIMCKYRKVKEDKKEI